MATDLGTETVTVNKKERAWRTEIESPFGGIPSVVAHIEVVRTLPDGSLFSRDAGPDVFRSFASLDKDSVEVNGKTYTASETAEVIKAFITKWAGEDRAAKEEQP